MAYSKRPSYLMNRSGIWYFQRGVPGELQNEIGKKVWAESLNTRDREQAERLVLEHIVKSDKEIERLKNRATAQDRVATLPISERREIEEAGGIDAFLSEIESNLVQHAFISAGQPSHVSDAIGASSLENAVPGDRTDREYNRLETAQARAQLDEVRRIINEKSRVLSKLGLRLDGAERIARADQPGLHEVRQDRASKSNLPEQTERMYRYAIRRFIELHGDLPVVELNREHLAQFSAKVGELPHTTRRDIMDLPFVEAVEKGKREGIDTIADATRKKHVAALKTMMAHALNEGIVTDDPFAGYRMIKPRQSAARQSDARVLPFSPDDLNTLISAMEKRGLSASDDEYWIPFVALYQGTRQEETCQLETADIIKIDGIDCMKITDAGQGDKKVKNRSSVRTIPIHPKLVKMGFLKHVRRSDNHRIFPTLKPDSRGRLGGPYGKRFSRLLRKNAGITDNRKRFHSFRHTWTDAARNAGVDAEIRMRLAGREFRETGSEAGYGTGHSIPILYKALAKVDPFKR